MASACSFPLRHYSDLEIKQMAAEGFARATTVIDGEVITPMATEPVEGTLPVAYIKVTRTWKGQVDQNIAPVAYISTPNRLTLAPPGAVKSDNPWHIREYDPTEYRALLSAHFDRVEVLGLFHAGKLRAHELAIKAGWDRLHRLTRLTKPFYDRFIPSIGSGDFALREAGDLEKALDFVGVCHVTG